MLINIEDFNFVHFTGIINSQNYPLVYALDPHSEVCVALLNKRIVSNYNDEVKDIC